MHGPTALKELIVTSIVAGKDAIYHEPSSEPRVALTRMASEMMNVVVVIDARVARGWGSHVQLSYLTIYVGVASHRR